MTYVTGAAILTHVNKGSPTPAETTWAGLCADAMEGAIATLLEGYTPTTSAVDELEVAALTDGAALFNSKAAPNGILSMGPDGDAVRLGADILRALWPAIRRAHPTGGYGIG